MPPWNLCKQCEQIADQGKFRQTCACILKFLTENPEIPGNSVAKSLAIRSIIFDPIPLYSAFQE